MDRAKCESIKVEFDGSIKLVFHSAKALVWTEEKDYYSSINQTDFKHNPKQIWYGKYRIIWLYQHKTIYSTNWKELSWEKK